MRPRRTSIEGTTVLCIVAEQDRRIPLKTIRADGPYVGIWWHSKSRLVPVIQSIEAVPTTGDLIDSDLAHADEWPLVARHLRESPASEYFMFPRGRTLYDRSQKRGTIYHGNGTDQAKLKQLARLFGLKNWIALVDDHYLIGNAADEFFEED